MNYNLKYISARRANSIPHDALLHVRTCLTQVAHIWLFFGCVRRANGLEQVGRTQLSAIGGSIDQGGGNQDNSLLFLQPHLCIQQRIVHVRFEATRVPVNRFLVHACLVVHLVHTLGVGTMVRAMSTVTLTNKVFHIRPPVEPNAVLLSIRQPQTNASKGFLHNVRFVNPLSHCRIHLGGTVTSTVGAKRSTVVGSIGRMTFRVDTIVNRNVRSKLGVRIQCLGDKPKLVEHVGRIGIPRP